MQGLFASLIARCDAADGRPFLALFALTAALFLYHAARAAWESRAGLAARLRAELPPLLGLAALAALVRLLYCPAEFMTIGLDTWTVGDAARVFSTPLSAPLEAPRSAAHAALFGLYLKLAGFGLPSAFYFNFAAGLLASLLCYAVLRLNSVPAAPALAGSAVAATAPAAVLASGGLLDGALSGLLIMLFLAAWYAFLRSPGRRRFALASLALALAGQARQENFMLLALYAALLLLARRRLPADLKKPRSLAAGLACAALCLPYGLKQACNYIAFHEGPRAHERWGGLAAQAAEAFSNLPRYRFVWLYDGVNLTALALAAAAWAVWRAWRARDPQEAAWPPAGCFLAYLAAFVPAARFTGYMPWYPLAAAPCFILAVWLVLRRYESRRVLGALAAAWLALNLYGARAQADPARRSLAKVTAVVRFAQDELLGREGVKVFFPRPFGAIYGALFDGSNGRHCAPRGCAWCPPQDALTAGRLASALEDGGLAYYLPPLPSDSYTAPEDCEVPPGYGRAPAYELSDGGRVSYTVWRLLPAGAAAPPPVPVKL